MSFGWASSVQHVHIIIIIFIACHYYSTSFCLLEVKIFAQNNQRLFTSIKDFIHFDGGHGSFKMRFSSVHWLPSHIFSLSRIFAIKMRICCFVFAFIRKYFADVAKLTIANEANDLTFVVRWCMYGALTPNNTLIFRQFLDHFYIIWKCELMFK